jgi:hypothetical protein
MNGPEKGRATLLAGNANGLRQVSRAVKRSGFRRLFGKREEDRVFAG